MPNAGWRSKAVCVYEISSFAMVRSIVAAALSGALASVAHAYDDGVQCRPPSVSEAPAQDASKQIPSTLVIQRGTVEAVDPVNRLLELRDANGKTTILYVDTDVAAFEQLRLGEPITVRYAQPLVLAIIKAGVFGSRAVESQRGLDPLDELSMSITAERMHARTSISGKVVSLPPADARIAVVGNDGRNVELCAAHPDSLGDLRIGDRVLVTYVEAMAVSVQADQPGPTRSLSGSGAGPVIIAPATED